QARDRGDRVRERRRVRRPDVDVPDRLERVLDTEALEQARRSGRELPVDQDGDPSGREEAVAEASIPVARAVVEPDEEDRGQDEMADEVEEVHRLDQLRHAEKRPLDRLLPGDVRGALEGV